MAAAGDCDDDEELNVALFMENTQIEEGQTVAAIHHLLATRGASSVLVEYQAGKVSSVSFALIVGETRVPFRLPCRWQAVERILKSSKRKPRRNDSWESWARRVSWRQILRWVEAQLALVETGMVKAQEVFLPYACVGDQTMYQVIEQKQFLSLPAPKPEKSPS